MHRKSKLDGGERHQMSELQTLNTFLTTSLPEYGENKGTKNVCKLNKHVNFFLYANYIFDSDTA